MTSILHIFDQKHAQNATALEFFHYVTSVLIQYQKISNRCMDFRGILKKKDKQTFHTGSARSPW